MEQLIGSGLRKEYDRAVCCHRVCLYAEYIMRNAGWSDIQCGIKIDSRNINNLRYADDTTLMAENKEVSKSFLMRVKEESSKTGLELSIKKLMVWPHSVQFSSVQSLSCVRLFAAP